MRPINAVIIGAIAGGSILIVGSLAVHLGRNVAEQATSTPAAGYDSNTRDKHSTTTSPFDLCMAIGEPYGCTNFRFAATSRFEDEAGTAIVGDRRVRVSTYSGGALLDAVSASGGRSGGGKPLTILVGGNWTLTWETQPAESPAFAQGLAVRMGGQWIDPADLGWED